MALIRREEAVAAIDRVRALSVNTQVLKNRCRDVVSNESEVPSVEAVEVVRCKDCRYWRHEVDAHTHWVCRQHSYIDRLIHTAPDFFCADGKRRENDADG